jgi:hypothetical protein
VSATRVAWTAKADRLAKSARIVHKKLFQIVR